MDCKQLALALYKTVKLWVPRLGTLLQTLKGHSDSVNAIAFSPDGKQLASASHDKTIKLWDTCSEALLQTLEGHSDSFSAIAFSANGKQLASASHDRTVQLWDPQIGALLRTFQETLPLSSLLSDRAAVPYHDPPSVFVRGPWLCDLHTGRFLWLPPEHRQSIITLVGNFIGFDSCSGIVTIIAFSF